jgi:hypothetical protein
VVGREMHPGWFLFCFLLVLARSEIKIKKDRTPKQAMAAGFLSVEIDGSTTFSVINKAIIIYSNKYNAVSLTYKEQNTKMYCLQYEYKNNKLAI